MFAEEIAHSVQADRAVRDGEIVCLGPDGRTRFYDLLFRREWPYFYAFDLLSLEDQDLRGRPLIERKRQLRRLIPRSNSRLLYADHIEARGVGLFREASARDLEGIVEKWRRGRYYTDGTITTWVKIKSAEYSQALGGHEL